MLKGMELNFEGLVLQKWKKWLIFVFFADDSLGKTFKKCT